jgi:hypothetical protein
MIPTVFCDAVGKSVEESLAEEIESLSDSTKCTSTTIKFHLSRSEHVTERLYSIGGKEIETLLHGDVGAEEDDLRWTPCNLASDMYLCTMRAGKCVETRKMIYQK